MRQDDGSASTRSQLVSAPPDALWFDGRGLCLTGAPPQPCAGESIGSGRLELLLALAFRRRVSTPMLAQVVKAAEESRRGDHALANIRLAFAGLDRVPNDRDLPARLGMADTLLAKGMTAAAILDELFKFDPEQPRVPAGSGAASGQWTSGGEGASGTAMAIAVAPTAARAAPLFAPEASAAVLGALPGVAAAAGAAIAVGSVLFVPWQKSVSSNGPLPGGTGHTYSYNSDEGLLQVRDGSGAVVAAGHKDAAGIFHDVETDVPFARELNGSLMFDDVVTDANTSTQADAASRSQADTDEKDKDKELCPAPGPDNPGAAYASPRAKAYQEQISRMINPANPLQVGESRNLINPLTGAIVHFDECDEQTGTMIDAKGPGIAGILSFPAGQKKETKDLLDQSERQVAAAGARAIVWYFAEPAAATYTAELFQTEDKGRERITIKVVPAEVP